MDVGKFNGRRLYTGLRLDYRLRPWTFTSASRAVSAVAEVLVCNNILCMNHMTALPTECRGNYVI